MTEKAYREAYVKRIVPETLALQIKSLRNKHGWSQATLGKRADGIKQPTISRLEDPDDDSYTIGTLTRLAAAFDVALICRFVPFRELVDWTQTLSPKTLMPLSYQEEQQSKTQLTTTIKAQATGSTASETIRMDTGQLAWHAFTLQWLQPKTTFNILPFPQRETPRNTPVANVELVGRGAANG